jgi:hypothetical protein
MADVAINDGALQISLTVPERVFSLHGGSVVVPLAEIRGVRIVRDVLGQVRGLRMPGAGVPGRVAIGTWRGTADGRPFHDFVLVRTAGPGVVITTAGNTYDRILLDSETPEQLAADLGAWPAQG